MARLREIGARPEVLEETEAIMTRRLQEFDDADSIVVRTLEDADTVLATMAGGTDSLLDTDFFAAAVAALGKGAVLQAMGVPQPQPFDPAVVVLGTEAIEELLEDVVLVPTYDGLLIAELYDGGQSQTTLLFVYGAITCRLSITASTLK